ncbi:hypothetical protein BC940DRAFT_347313 [Gongronella butleri]|nr:hypothetical protein BC940DRAFT_347313 [Gongronella butleri]
MPQKRRVNDESEASSAASHRDAKQARSGDFVSAAADVPSGEAILPGGRPLAIAEDDPVRIPSVDKEPHQRLSTNQLVAFLNDPNNKEYNETTVTRMYCSRPECRNSKPIKDFMKVTTRNGSIRKQFLKKCKACRERHEKNRANQVHRLARDIERTKEAIKELNNRKAIPESSLVCVGRCKQWRAVDQFKGAPKKNGKSRYMTTCSRCRGISAKHQSKKKEKQKADVEAANGDAEKPVECHACGFEYPLSEFLGTNGKQEHACSSCRQRGRKNSKDHQEKHKVSRAACEVDTGFKECSQCAHVLPIDEFDTVEGVPRSRCKACLLQDQKNDKKKIESGKTHTHSPHSIKMLGSSMRSRNLKIRQKYIESHLNALNDDLDAIAPLLPQPDFQSMFMEILADENETCGLCGRAGLQVQHVEHLEDGDMGRATPQRIDPTMGYSYNNVMILCLTCNRFLNDLQPMQAMQLLDSLFGDNDTTTSSRLSTAEISNIKKLAQVKGIPQEVLLEAARHSRHRCALTNGTGTFTSDKLPAQSRSMNYRMDALSFDRVVPAAMGGEYTANNIQVVSVYVNIAKGKLPQDKFDLWLERMGQQGSEQLKDNLKAAIRRAEARAAARKSL